MKKIWKKLLAITLALSMTMSMVSITSLAVEEEEGTADTVTLTYDANAGTDEVRGLPADQEVERGETVKVSDYSGMSRTGYTPLGWSTTKDAEQPDVGEAYTLTADTTLFAVWEKSDTESEKTHINASNVVVGNFIYDFHEDGTAAVVAGSVVNGEINIPATVTYRDMEYRVTAIGDGAFNGLNKYAKITLPEGLETIGASAFRGIYPYGGDLVIPDSVTSIGDFAFYGFHKYAKEAYHIDKIVLGENLKTIGNQAFYFAMPTGGFYQVEVECGPNLESVHKWAFPYGYDKNTYTYHSCVSTLTINGVLDGSPEAIALDEVLNVSYGLQPSYGVKRVYPLGVDLSNIATVNGLQAAINASEGPTTLELTGKIYTVDEPIVIPAGKDITLTEKDGVKVVFEAKSYKSTKSLFIIEKGGKLTIDAKTQENLTINGAALGKPGRMGALVFQVNGELVLKNALINGGGDGYMTMGMFSGAIVLGKGANFLMEGGTLQGTNLSGPHTAPVVVPSEATFTMTSGKITQNINSTYMSTGYAGGAVLAYGWSERDVGGKMILTGDAEISSNTSKHYGAVTLVGNAELYMDGGKITGNVSNGGTGASGGGVCVAGRTGGMDKTYDAKCVFTMDGGEISNNTARYGGGIYVNSNHVTLNAGTISGNTAGETGGGVYVETPHGNKTGAHFKNVVISGNTASYMGGGMYFCPTGNASLYVNEGCAIFDNKAVNNTSTNSGMAAADDFVSVVNSNVWSDESKHALLSERALGGGLVQWYLDGSVSDPTLGGGWGGVDSDSVRYDPANPVQVESGDYDTNLALKTVMSDSAKALAIANATLLITGNTANRGGGVGSNGSATMGADPNDPVDPTPSKEYTLKVNKVWENVPESEQKPVTIQLLVEISDKVYELDSVELNKDNNWTGSFEGLPEVVIGKLSIKELVDGYVTDYSEITEDGTELSATVTNRPITYSLTINKVVAGGDDTAAEKTYTFTVEGPNGYKKDDVTITGTGRAILSGLLPGTYTVTENRADADISGYTLEVTGEGEVEVKAENEAVITITNTYEPTYTPPTTTYTSLTVNKVWAGDDGETRPDSVTVQLYRNGAAYESRTLNEANGWSTTWSGLNAAYTWTVDEVNVPEGYTPSQSRRGTTVTITNTFTEDVKETDTPTTESPEPTESPDPTESPAPTESPDPTETQEPDETEDLDETDTPLAEKPDVEPTETPDEGEDLGDNDTPLADVPQTGDMLWLWMTLAAGSAVSLAWISAEEKKGKRVSK